MISYTTFQLSLELVGSLFTIFCACAMLLEKKIFPRKSMLLCLLLFVDAALLVSDAIALGFRGVPGRLGFYLVRISNFLVFILMPAMIILVYYFIADIIESNEGYVRPIWTRLLFLFCGLQILLLIISQCTDLFYYFDETNTYHRTPAFPLLTVLGLIELLVLSGIVLVHRKEIRPNIRIVLLLYILMPVISAIIQTFHYGIALNNIAATIALLLLFLTYQITKSNLYYEQQEILMAHEMALKNQELILSNQERELTEAKLQLSLSQMQPHFMFNALGSIEQLCRIDSKRAAEATHYFAQYLRNNLLAMNTTSLKSFSDEIRHIHAYIWLEKMRFGEDLEYSEDLNVSDFMLPVLSIQPLVENSVNKGMRLQEEGIISIKLRAYEDANSYHIEIEDNLVDFIPDFFTEEHFEGSILTNISERMKLMCNGSVQMIRVDGKGSCYNIRVPKKKN